MDHKCTFSSNNTSVGPHVKWKTRTASSPNWKISDKILHYSCKRNKGLHHCMTQRRCWSHRPIAWALPPKDQGVTTSPSFGARLFFFGINYYGRRVRRLGVRYFKKVIETYIKRKRKGLGQYPINWWDWFWRLDLWAKKRRLRCIAGNIQWDSVGMVLVYRI